MNFKYIRNVTTPTATYVQPDFTEHIKDKQNIKVIVECGSRDLLDALQLEILYPNATILSFECNPECVDVCKHNIQNSQGRIKFFNYALSNIEGEINFHSFDTANCPAHNAGISSIYQHKDVADAPMNKIKVQSKTLKSILKNLNITQVDMLCLDLQGGEYNLLLGLEELIDTVKFIIAEFDSDFYTNAPSNQQLINFLTANNFIPIYTHGDTLFKRSL